MIVEDIWYNNPISKLIVLDPVFEKNENDEIVFKIMDESSLPILYSYDELSYHKIEEIVGTIIPIIIFEIKEINQELHSLKSIDDESVSHLNDTLYSYIDKKIQSEDYDFSLNKALLNVYIIIREGFRRWAKRVDPSEFQSFINLIGPELTEYIFNPKILYFYYPIPEINDVMITNESNE